MQKHLNKILLFIVNILLMVIAVLVIKEQDRKNLAIETSTDSTLTPIDQKVLDTQNAITTDRENKLRKLNNTPQALKAQQVTTTTTTAVTKPTSTSSSSSSGSSSKSSSSSSRTTKKS